MLAAAEFAGVVEAYWDEQERNNADLVCTIGQFHTDAEHHGITKIPGELRFTMDIRSLDNAVLLQMDDYLREQAQQISRKRRVDIELGSYTNALPAVMDPTLRALLHAEAQALDIPVLELASGAGHDCAVFANQGVASAMIFVRNDKGSHNPEETMMIEDFAEATRLLVSLLKRLS